MSRPPGRQTRGTGGEHPTHRWLARISFDRLQPGAGFVWLDHEQVLERTRQAVRDRRSDPPKDVLAGPGPAARRRCVRSGTQRARARAALLRNSRARPVRAAGCSRRQASSNRNCSSCSHPGIDWPNAPPGVLGLWFVQVAAI